MECRTAKLLLAVLIVAVTYTVCDGSTWTDRKGRQVEAEYIAFEEGKVKIQRISDGKLFDIPLENLSDVDQAFVKSKHREALPAEQGKAKIARSGDKSPPPPAIARFTSAQANLHQKAWANHLKVPVESSNSIRMKMVLIPPGEFLMGSPESDEYAMDNEKPQHKVRITKPFEMAAH
jgi:formylglycine-generating enzyme required for sulfatase activity